MEKLRLSLHTGHPSAMYLQHIHRYASAIYLPFYVHITVLGFALDSAL